MTNLLIYYTQEETTIYDLGKLSEKEECILNLLHNIEVNVDKLTPNQQEASVQLVAMLSDRPYEDDDISDPSLFCKWKDKKVDQSSPWEYEGAIRIFKTGFFL